MAEWPYSTAQWQRLRKVKLSASPLCEDCSTIGRHTPASHVDHVHAISDGGPPFPNLNGLRALCPSCHSAKTARGAEAGAVRSKKPRRGCDADGNPLDQNHPWQSISETSVQNVRSRTISRARSPKLGNGA
jgi:5-methylcytosine-specific restriction protein A